MRGGSAGQEAGHLAAVRVSFNPEAGRAQGRSRSKPASTTTPLTTISATECCPT